MPHDPRHRAWVDIHDLLPEGWHVVPPSFNPGRRRWIVVARFASIATTANTYGHCTESMAERTAERMAAILGTG